MEGTVTYTDSSILSPFYQYPIIVDNIEYPSIAMAIQANMKRAYSLMIGYVNQNRDRYEPYRRYAFRSSSKDDESLQMEYLLNKAIQYLLVPTMEPIQADRYVFVLPPDLDVQSDIQMIPIVRHIYTLEHVHGNLFKYKYPLNKTEPYQKGKIDGYDLYVGKQGSFIVSSHPIEDAQDFITSITTKS